MTQDEIAAAFHSQVRLADRDAAPGLLVEHDGPVHRTYPADPSEAGAMIEAPEGLGEDPQHWIARQVEFFGGRGQRVEWKTYGTDEPRDIGARLQAAGFVPEDEEVLLLGACADLVHDVDLPSGVRLRAFDSDEDWERVRTLIHEVWGDGSSWVNDHFKAEQRLRPDLMIPMLAEESEDGPVLSYAIVRFTQDTDFCGLWGGSTLPQWRRRGLYRALLTARARLALDHGYPLARVDTSPDSRPILRALGMHAVTTTTPYIFTPVPR